MRVLGGLLIFCFFQMTWAAETVRVRLQSLSDSVQVSGLGVTAKVSENHYAKVSIPRFQAFKILLKQSVPVAKWRIRGETIYGGPLKVEGEMLQIGLQQMPRTVYLYPRKNKKFDVIAEFDLEDYLMGVLPNEMPVSWPIEALKAQAIVARSYALSMVSDARAKKGYHLETNIFDQVFRPSKLNSITPYQKNKLLDAIRSTRGELLVNSSQLPIKAHYHADCGGRTESAFYVWQGSKNFGVANDKYCPQSPSARWSYSINENKLAKKLFKLKARVTGVNVLSKTPSRRNWLLSFDIDGLRYDKVLNSQEVRKRLGFMNLRSTSFTVSKLKKSYLFVGSGFGHGVGMCQWGAKTHAVNGKTYKQILKHYYPRARLNIDRVVPKIKGMQRLVKDKKSAIPLKI